MGKIGLIAPRLGIAIGVGSLPLALCGGIIGLGIYGLGKMLNSSPESSFQAFERMGNYIDSHYYYSSALLELQLMSINRELTFTQLDRQINLLEIEVLQIKYDLSHLFNLSSRVFGCYH